MRAVRCACLAAIAVAACGDGIDAPAMWDLANDEVHRIHGVAFANGAQPMIVDSYDCVLGGSVEMSLSYEGGAAMGNLSSLLHTFRDCQLEDAVVNGQLDYTGVSFCEDGTPSLAIDGLLSLTGGFNEECEFRGSEICGKVSGTVCGVKAR